MDIEGCLIVADALNCHQKAAEAVVAGKADYLLDVRANQRNLEEEIAEYVKNDDLRGRMDKKRTVERTASGLKFGRRTRPMMLNGYAGRKNGRGCAASAQSERKSKLTASAPKSSTTTFPAANCRRKNCFIMHGWSGRSSRCTGC